MTVLRIFLFVLPLILVNSLENLWASGSEGGSGSVESRTYDDDAEDEENKNRRKRRRKKSQNQSEESARDESEENVKPD